MPYDSQITRSDVQIPEEMQREIVQRVPTRSAVLSIARRLPNMARAQQRMRVLSALPTAYFVQGDTGLKQTAEQAWQNKFINAEEIAAIVPVPESVVNDLDYDLWGEVQPRIEESIGKVIDLAVIHGTNAPAAWPDDIVTAATAAGHAVTLGTGVDLYEDLFGLNGVLAKVEADGFNITGHVSAMSMRARLRGMRDADGHPLWMMIPGQPTTYTLEGVPMTFPQNGGITPAAALQISGDFSELVYSIRQDVSVKILTEAVIQDSAGNIIYNLAQQDMVALRCVIRLGWEIPNPVTPMEPTEASRYPFAVLKPA